ncbi:plasmid recombination protein [Hansschlegelia beijingensis]|uniref:Plasmid recombination enzyme n=1 Tax=Hansschlegelia beijingensis TaxID=1133344 RepID=A0A7W6CZA9_9HYPH|nr:plasmid recombination protein [Hansschlegelia beijingensis]MBB3971831.1 hypothetical protein [Hansschlegelia beijingensis]
MPKFDFFHIIGYPRAARKTGDPKAHVAGIIAEAERQRHACRHVPSPMKPIRLFGGSPSEAAAEAIAQADHARDAIGRKVRIDAIVMFAAVASYPKQTSSVVSRDHGGRRRIVDPAFLAWKEAALKWAQKQFGSALKSAVLHLDEEYPHIHFFIVPPLLEGRLRHDLIHCGRAAIVAAREKSVVAGAPAPGSDRESKRAERLAYCTAMSGLLDDYHDAVGSRFGHERYGPRRRRRTREVHLTTRRLERERDKAIMDAKRRLQNRLIELRNEDEARLAAREAEAAEEFHRARRYRASMDAELAAQRSRGDNAEAALADALAILEAHGLSPSVVPRSCG